jgi:hypothetical protein
MRRFLIALTLVILLALSITVGVIVAGWPHWRDGSAPNPLSTASDEIKTLN